MLGMYDKEKGRISSLVMSYILWCNKHVELYFCLPYYNKNRRTKSTTMLHFKRLGGLVLLASLGV